MDQGAQAHSFRFVTSRVKLGLRKERVVARWATSRDDLDYIRTGFFLLSHERANVIRLAALVALPDQRLGRSQQARAGQKSFGDRIAERNVGGRANTLHRGESG